MVWTRPEWGLGGISKNLVTAISHHRMDPQLIPPL